MTMTIVQRQEERQEGIREEVGEVSEEEYSSTSVHNTYTSFMILDYIDTSFVGTRYNERKKLPVSLWSILT